MNTGHQIQNFLKPRKQYHKHGIDDFNIHCSLKLICVALGFMIKVLIENFLKKIFLDKAGLSAALDRRSFSSQKGLPPRRNTWADKRLHILLSRAAGHTMPVFYIMNQDQKGAFIQSSFLQVAIFRKLSGGFLKTGSSVIVIQLPHHSLSSLIKNCGAT